MSELPLGVPTSSEYANQLTDWLLLEKNFEVHSALHLTWRQDIAPDRQEKALWWWRALVKHLNQGMCYGEGPKDHRRRWGHSYFSYVVGVEMTTLGAVHLHAVVDNWIDYRRAHDWWNYFCGWLWIKTPEDKPRAMRYALKYAIKCGAFNDWPIFLRRARSEVSVYHSTTFNKPIAAVIAPRPPVGGRRQAQGPEGVERELPRKA